MHSIHRRKMGHREHFKTPKRPWVKVHNSRECYQKAPDHLGAQRLKGKGKGICWVWVSKLSLVSFHSSCKKRYLSAAFVHWTLNTYLESRMHTVIAMNFNRHCHNIGKLLNMGINIRYLQERGCKRQTSKNGLLIFCFNTWMKAFTHF